MSFSRTRTIVLPCYVNQNYSRPLGSYTSDDDDAIELERRIFRKIRPNAER